MGTWLTADPHWGHERVSELRGFRTTALHDRELMRRWTRCVQPEDVVYVLGDLSAGGRDATFRALRIHETLPGHQRIVLGNHDPAHASHGPSSVPWRRVYGEVFEDVTTHAFIRVEGVKLLLSHFPFTADHTETAREKLWRFPNLGDWLAHGHTHSEKRWTSPREIHVGMDAWDLRPVNLGEVAKLIVDQREREASA